MGSLFREHHGKCLEGWDRAIKSGEIEGLSQYPSNDYQGFFGYKGTSNVTPTSQEEAIRGLHQLLSYVVGTEHMAQHRIIKMRTDSEAVVSYLRDISRDDSLKMTFFVLQTWRIENDEWKLDREIAENI